MTELLQPALDVLIGHLAEVSMLRCQKLARLLMSRNDGIQQRAPRSRTVGKPKTLFGDFGCSLLVFHSGRYKRSQLKSLYGILKNSSCLSCDIFGRTAILATFGDHSLVAEAIHTVRERLEESTDLSFIAHRAPPPTNVLTARRRRFAAELYSFSVSPRHDWISAGLIFSKNAS